MKQFDKVVKAITLDDLANYFCESSSCNDCKIREFCDTFSEDVFCLDIWKAWLNSEVKENDA